MTMTMTMTNLTEHILSPLIRGDSKAGFYLTEHKDTETQSFISNTEPTKKRALTLINKMHRSLTPAFHSGRGAWRGVRGGVRLLF